MNNTLNGVNLPTYQISTPIPTGAIPGGGVTNNGNIQYSYTNSAGYSIGPSVHVTQDPASLVVKGKIIHNGIDLEERLKTIEKVLMIPERDVKLEKNYPKLKKLYDDYITELSKVRMWESLKGDKNE
jgi:predicted transcriptional regulator